jgi:hypothetical protein
MSLSQLSLEHEDDPINVAFRGGKKDDLPEYSPEEVAHSIHM